MIPMSHERTQEKVFGSLDSLEFGQAISIKNLKRLREKVRRDEATMFLRFDSKNLYHKENKRKM